MEFNNQRTFDLVVAHLRKQGKKAFGKVPSLINPGCFLEGYRYRTEDGLKCAAGCLIPDSKYSPDFENVLCFGHSMSQPIEQILKEEGHDPVFVCQLQSIHDGSEPPQWEYKFFGLATEYGLSYLKP